MDDPEHTRGVVPTPLKRRRPALSCAECRRRKVKCDRANPCDPCKKFKSPTCTYGPNRLQLNSNNDHVSISISSPSPSLNRNCTGDGNTDGIEAAPVRPDSSSALHNNTVGTSEQLRLGIQHVQTGQSDNADLIHRIERLEQSLSSARIIGKVVDNETSKNGSPSRLKGTMLKNRYFGHGHWISAIAQSKSFMCFDTAEKFDGVIKMKNKDDEGSINAMLHSCKLMAKAIKAAEYPQWTILGITFQHTMPDRGVADELVSHYLRTHESAYRIVHIPSFEREYEQYWADPSATSTVSLIKILLVMVIGTCFYKGQDFDSHKTQALHWIHTAQSWLTSPRDKSRFNTATVQVECLLLLARSMWGTGADILWNHTGSLLRTSMSMGFHRDPKHFKRFSFLHSEVRRRLWATILEINIQACLDSGMTPMISRDDFDTEPPSNINDDEINESIATQPLSHPSHIFTQSSVQITLLDSLTTRLEVANFLSNCRDEASYEEVIRLDKDLIQTYKAGHSKFARAAQDVSAKFRPTTLHRKIFDLKLQESLLVLHRPYAMEARNRAKFYYSHRVYLDTALAVHSAPSKDLVVNDGTDGYEFEDDYTRFRLINCGFLKEILIQSVIVIYQEMISPLEEELSCYFREERISTREPYLQVLRDMMLLSYQRLEAGETAVKSHFMYSVAFAHISALEKKISPEKAMVEAAILSLSEAMEILKRRIASMPAALGNNLESEIGDIPVGDIDFSMQDWGAEFNASDSWLSSGWPLMDSWSSGF